MFYGGLSALLLLSPPCLSLKSALPFLKSRQLIALGIAWLGFNYVNYCFVTFNVDFFQTGMGMNQSIAALIGSICSAAGIIAPLFGAVSDRINKNRKYLMIVFGCVGLLIASRMRRFRSGCSSFSRFWGTPFSLRRAALWRR